MLDPCIRSHPSGELSTSSSATNTPTINLNYSCYCAQWLLAGDPTPLRQIPRGGPHHARRWNDGAGCGLLRFMVYLPQAEPSLLVCRRPLEHSPGFGVASRSKTGLGLTYRAIFLLVPQVRLRLSEGWIRADGPAWPTQ